METAGPVTRAPAGAKAILSPLPASGLRSAPMRLHALPLMVGTLCVLAIAYRFYSAFIAARIFALDPTRRTPAHERSDGKDYIPMSRWVLFGHHFAAITGAGPLINPI